MKNYRKITILDLFSSEVARLNKIKNATEDREILDNVEYTANRLNEIQKASGIQITISSGFRCKELNDAVGGKEDSKHLIGLAADIVWEESLFEFIKDNCSFDHLYREEKSYVKWIHVDFCRNSDDEQNIVENIKL